MADLSTLFAYDETYEVEALNPIDGSPLGIKFNIVSFDSARVVKAAKRIENGRMFKMFSVKDMEEREKIFADYTIDDESEKIIACIDSWDFNGYSWGDLPENPECNEENKRYFVTHPNSKWIVDQIKFRASNLENFSKPPAKSSPKPSKSK